jgi:tetratricopeptide (TPR) repeat protein
VAQRAAEASQRRADDVTKFVTDALVSTDPQRGGRPGRLVTESMEQAVAWLDAGALEHDPETEAVVRATISKVFLGNERAAEAAREAERAVAIRRRLHGGDHPELLRALLRLGYSLALDHRPEQALERQEEAVAMARRLYPGRLYADGHAHLARALQQQARALEGLGRPHEALVLHEEAVAMHERIGTPNRAPILFHLGTCLWRLGRDEESLRCYEQALGAYREHDGNDEWSVAMSLDSIGDCLYDLGELPEALTKKEEAHELFRHIYRGDDNAYVAYSWTSMGRCLDALGRSDEALALHEAALKVIEHSAEVDGEHAQRASTMVMGRYERTLFHRGACLHALGRPADALPDLEAAVEMRRSRKASADRVLGDYLVARASCLESLGRPEEALDTYEEALAINDRLLPPSHPLAIGCRIGMARTLVTLGDHAEAEPLLIDAAEGCERSDVARWWHGRAVAEETVRLYEAWHAAEPGQAYDAEADEWRAKLEQAQTSTTP